MSKKRLALQLGICTFLIATYLFGDISNTGLIVGAVSGWIMVGVNDYIIYKLLNENKELKEKINVQIILFYKDILFWIYARRLFVQQRYSTSGKCLWVDYNFDLFCVI